MDQSLLLILSYLTEMNGKHTVSSRNDSSRNNKVKARREATYGSKLITEESKSQHKIVYKTTEATCDYASEATDVTCIAQISQRSYKVSFKDKKTYLREVLSETAKELKCYKKVFSCKPIKSELIN